MFSCSLGDLVFELYLSLLFAFQPGSREDLCIFEFLRNSSYFINISLVFLHQRRDTKLLVHIVELSFVDGPSRSSEAVAAATSTRFME